MKLNCKKINLKKNSDQKTSVDGIIKKKEIR